MKAKDISKILDKIAPPSLAYVGEELGFVVGGGEKEVKVVGVTERPTVEVLEEAVEKKVDMLIIHEPLYHSEKTMVIDKSLLSFPANEKRKKLVEKGKIAVFRYHSQWDEADDGINETLAKILEMEVTDKIPYGRVGEVEPQSLKELSEFVKRKLSCQKVLVVGDLNRKIKRAGVVAGSGNSLNEMIEYVKQKGAEVLISGDITDGRARFAKEIGLCLIDAGDYFTENPGTKNLADILKTKISGVNVVHLDPGKPWTSV